MRFYCYRQEPDRPRRIGQLLVFMSLSLLTNLLFGGGSVIMPHYSCVCIANWMFIITHLSIFSDAANASALKLTCELLRVFITEAIQRAVAIAETEGDGQIEATHLESILPQLLLDF
ncbi:FANCM-MHF complex subunit Mhf2 [Lathyrus oleraceus]|uniref:FANCM-MHF complex subunit Mhf2 n=1 Tax=Pisum sativum TaxID=3888 RepID=A0A9D4X9Z2_PEA|nr:FANCM-MHF complex subunit Mhf2 [Pisum sativum]